MTDVVSDEHYQEPDQVSDEELKAVFESRSANYGLLSRLFRKEVDKELLQELHDMRYRVSTGNANMDEGNRLMATALSNLWENSDTELAADFMRVFFGHGYNGHAAAYPFESVYTSERRLLMGSSRDQVLALYRAAKLEKSDAWKDGEDHIALELEYMQILSQRTVEALERGDQNKALSLVKAQHSFLEDHLTNWVPMLCAEIPRFAQTDFYKALGYMLEGTVETDYELLSDMLAQD